MVDDIISIFTLALVITAIGIVVSHGAETAQILKVGLNGFTGIQKAAYGK